MKLEPKSGSKSKKELDVNVATSKKESFISDNELSVTPKITGDIGLFQRAK
jgi:hypothetical protein